MAMQIAYPAEPLLTIIGERVALGPLDPELAPLYARWRNDLFVQRTFGNEPRGVSLPAMRAWVEKRMEADDAYWFTIYARDLDDSAEAGADAPVVWEPVGTTDLFDVNFRFRACMFGMQIGEARARGRGLGTEVVRLMLDLAFVGLGMRNVMLSVAEYNLAGRRAYVKAGFREMGRRRQADELNGVVYDEIYMDAVASEFESPVMAKVWAPDVPRENAGEGVGAGTDTGAGAGSGVSRA